MLREENIEREGPRHSVLAWLDSGERVLPEQTGPDPGLLCDGEGVGWKYQG